MDMTGLKRGLFVGLVLLMLAGCARTGQSTESAQLTLSGTVRAEPGCPGPVRLDSPCPPRPVAGATVEADQDGHQAASTTTGRDGRFTLRLAAGTYQVTATNGGGLKTTATQTVVLTAATDITLTVDSGMR
jgi:hypothetical protein